MVRSLFGAGRVRSARPIFLLTERGITLCEVHVQFTSTDGFYSVTAGNPLIARAAELAARNISAALEIAYSDAFYVVTKLEYVDPALLACAVAPELKG